MNESEKRVLRKLRALGKRLARSAQLFEAGGNDPDARTAVFDIVEGWSRKVCWRKGNDFYSLTERAGKPRSFSFRNQMPDYISYLPHLNAFLIRPVRSF